jgi:GDP-D-mannose dehydratase
MLSQKKWLFEPFETFVIGMDYLHAPVFLFNHESPLRPKHFVTQKIIAGACSIKIGQQKNLHLGDLSIKRDWGWAPEYVVAMNKMLTREQPDGLSHRDRKTNTTS